MSFKVNGRIYETESGSGIPGLVVKAFDKDVIVDDYLGETVTDSQGKFEIIYNEKDFGEAFEDNPDLYIVVKTPDRHQVLYTNKKIFVMKQMQVKILKSQLIKPTYSKSIH